MKTLEEQLSEAIRERDEVITRLKKELNTQRELINEAINLITERDKLRKELSELQTSHVIEQKSKTT